MDGMGQFWAMLSLGVLVVLVLALAVCVQSLRAHELGQTLNRYTAAWELLSADLKTQAEANRKLHSTLRAERAHVDQLQCKVLLVQILLDERIEADIMQVAGA